MTLVAQELAKYGLDLVGVQEVRLDGNGVSPIGDYILYYGRGNNNHQLGTGFLVQMGRTRSTYGAVQKCI